MTLIFEKGDRAKKRALDANHSFVLASRTHSCLRYINSNVKKSFETEMIQGSLIALPEYLFNKVITKPPRVEKIQSLTESEVYIKTRDRQLFLWLPRSVNAIKRLLSGRLPYHPLPDGHYHP